MKLLSIFENLLFPPICLSCQTRLYEHQMLCPSCWKNFRWLDENSCPKCAAPISSALSDSFCGDCFEKDFLWDRAVANFLYTDQSKEILLKFKHGNCPHYARPFADRLALKLAGKTDHIDYIAPVPLHFSRRFARHYNQAELISRRLAKLLKKPHATTLLKRCRRTTPQGTLSPAERTSNLRKAFKVSDSYLDKIKNKNILLVDDVRTSGATFNSCCKLLKSHGVNQITVASVAIVSFQG